MRCKSVVTFLEKINSSKVKVLANMNDQQMLRIQLASDLHLEHLEGSFPDVKLIAPAANADLLVLAGDIANGTRAIELFATWPVPVLFVAGNHEYYDRCWEDTRADIRNAARGTSVIFLDNEIADLSIFSGWCASRRDVVQRIRFLGSTMWTDYRYRAGRTQGQLMEHAELHIRDHFAIKTKDGRFTAGHALREHEFSRAWLEQELSTSFNGTTVVLTHHAPHPLSVHPRYLSQDSLATNAAYVSNLEPLLHKADIWLHGHVHDSFDYHVRGCRVVANPRGYARNWKAAVSVNDLQFENPAFQSACVVDVSV